MLSLAFFFLFVTARALIWHLEHCNIIFWLMRDLLTAEGSNKNHLFTVGEKSIPLQYSAHLRINNTFFAMFHVLNELLW